MGVVAAAEAEYQLTGWQNPPVSMVGTKSVVVCPGNARRFGMQLIDSKLHYL